MTNEERDLIARFISRVAGSPQGSGFLAGPGSVPQSQPALPPLDHEADAFIAQQFQQYPEARYRITQTALVQEAAFAEAQKPHSPPGMGAAANPAGGTAIRPAGAAAAEGLLRQPVRRRSATAARWVWPAGTRLWSAVPADVCAAATTISSELPARHVPGAGRVWVPGIGFDHGGWRRRRNGRRQRPDGRVQRAWRWRRGWRFRQQRVLHHGFRWRRDRPEPRASRTTPALPILLPEAASQKTSTMAQVLAVAALPIRRVTIRALIPVASTRAAAIRSAAVAAASTLAGSTTTPSV